MMPNYKDSEHPPKYAIVTGFVIGEFPEEIRQQKPPKTARTRNVDIGELTDELKAILAGVRPYRYVFLLIPVVRRN